MQSLKYYRNIMHLISYWNLNLMIDIEPRPNWHIEGKWILKNRVEYGFRDQEAKII